MLEQRAQFALWCIQASPLILGHDVTKMGPVVKAIITNKEMLALNQDTLGHRAQIVYQPDPYVTPPQSPKSQSPTLQSFNAPKPTRSPTAPKPQSPKARKRGTCQL